ncbi:glycerate kinase, partial [Leucobacter soli]|uniref:glycerate kinase n=1 Tax=Leucobacter soli TaxID=2812850 RepID=UPI0036175C85
RRPDRCADRPDTAASCLQLAALQQVEDAQSAQGKVVSLVQRIAAERGVPVALVAGRIGAPTDGFVAAHSLLRLAGQGQDPMRDAEAILREAGRRLAVEVGRA